MPNAFESLSTPELEEAVAGLEAKARELRAQGLSLDMARGKPNPEQTALARPMLDVLTSQSDLTDGAAIVDNYGTPEGLPSARRLAAEILGVSEDNVIVSGSSSLNLMHDLVTHAFTNGVGGCEPLCRQGRVKWLCPAPGYDRHFAVTAHLGMENVAVPLRDDGPDMDLVQELVEGDASVKGIWCVPKYSNPTGITYSDEVVRRFASLRPAAPDFRIYWDNAYVVHGFSGVDDELLNIFDALEESGARRLAYEFGSTAKVTFPSSGMAFVAADEQDIAEVREAFAVERVSPEKLSQLAHARFLKDLSGVRSHMERHAAIVAPRFALVEEKLAGGLAGLGIASWTRPHGGYFVSFDGPEGSARRIVSLAAELGVKLTPAGATWPYGKDPRDSNIRIAPTYPSLEDLSCALDVFVLAVKLVSARMALEGRGAQA
ncbi:PLP-dependent aminotransferase family protein [Olsenella urininfantis]|uniref:aminotransferase n=1 Tax=Olsenella urininfantis TaxID=1871033 RepID=UPI00098479A4|nr:aminotransferase [Olsenella urininfantis]